MHQPNDFQQTSDESLPLPDSDSHPQSQSSQEIVDSDQNETNEEESDFNQSSSESEFEETDNKVSGRKRNSIVSPSRKSKRQKLTEEDSMEESQNSQNEEKSEEEPENLEEYQKRSKELHTMWQFLIVLSFTEHFRETLELPKGYRTQDLEHAIVTTRKSEFLISFIINLLKQLRSSIPPTNEVWYRVLNNIINRHLRCFELGSPLKDLPQEDFFKLPTVVKVEILQYLCEWTLEENENFRELIQKNKDDALFLRPLPLGWDKDVNAYWRLGQSKLMYKEGKFDEVSNKLNSWQLVCSELEDWEKLAESFADSSHPDEKSFIRF